SRHFSFEEQTLALEQYFRAIATTPGGHLPKFRAVCRPYALEIARQQPPSSMPVRLMRLQYSIALSHVAGVGAASASTAAEQREAVETLLVVWGHMEASFHARRQIWETTQASFGRPVDFEEVAAGRIANAGTDEFVVQAASDAPGSIAATQAYTITVAAP